MRTRMPLFKIEAAQRPVCLPLIVILFVLAVLFSPSTAAQNSLDSPDARDGRDSLPFVLHNAAIYTVNPNQPWADALAVKDRRILAVGSEQTVLEQAGPTARRIDLQGRMVMPGFQDPHLHALEVGINGNPESLCVLPKEASVAAYREEIQLCAQHNSQSDWVRGAGVSLAALLDWQQLPIEVLDSLIPDRPVLILDDLGHGAWANTPALKAVGYDTLTGNPPGGIIDRDPETGRPTGLVFENAQQLLRTASFPPTPGNLDFMYQGLLRALEVLAKNGITSVSDAGGYWPRAQHLVWLMAERAGRLTVRASNALYVFPDKTFAHQISALRRLHVHNPKRLLRFNQAKIYIDGILSLGTSALYEPYEPGSTLPGISPQGFLYFDPKTLNHYAQRLEKIGYQLHFHATGDRGVGLALGGVKS